MSRVSIVGAYNTKFGSLIDVKDMISFKKKIDQKSYYDLLAEAGRGGILRLADGAPDIRAVREGRVAAGRGWIGITPRNAFVTRDVSIAPLLPAWAWLLIASVLTLAAWLREGRR